MGLLNALGLESRAHRAWAMYDWANSAFATVIMAAVLPPFFSSFYAAGLAPGKATSLYAVCISLALTAAAILSPILGTRTDFLGTKKPSLFFAMLTGALATMLLFVTPRGSLGLALALVFSANVAFSLAEVFYEALLPSISNRTNVDRISAAGYALGYLGGGLLLLVNTLWILHPRWFGMADSVQATRWAILSAGVWWLVFSTPVFRHVPEPPVTTRGPYRGWANTFRELMNTLRHLVRYRDLFVFLLAFWLYNDGIGTIIKMATIYGAELGIGMKHLISALLITQFIAFPCSFLFGALAGRIGPKRGIYLALAVYAVISALGYFMSKPSHFYALAILVGTVQGGSQALSRSLFTRMVPPSRSGEFFGFFSISSKFATVLGPLVFAAVNMISGSSRLALLSIVFFFVAGSVLLSFVDVERGERQAKDDAA